jgi:Clathrin adaptor complex small chain
MQELDLVLQFNKAYLILDEFILAGELQESSKQVILDRVSKADALPSDFGT